MAQSTNFWITFFHSSKLLNTQYLRAYQLCYDGGTDPEHVRLPLSQYAADVN